MVKIRFGRAEPDGIQRRFRAVDPDNNGRLTYAEMSDATDSFGS